MPKLFLYSTEFSNKLKPSCLFRHWINQKYYWKQQHQPIRRFDLRLNRTNRDELGSTLAAVAQANLFNEKWFRSQPGVFIMRVFPVQKSLSYLGHEVWSYLPTYILTYLLTYLPTYLPTRIWHYGPCEWLRVRLRSNVISVTRWLNYFSLFGYLKQFKCAQKL